MGDYRGGPAEAPAQARRSNPLARVHEAPWVMLVPMVALAILSTIGGSYGTPWADALGQFLAPVAGQGLQPDLFTPPGALLWVSFGVGILAGLIGIGVAWTMYIRRTPRLQPSRNVVYLLLLNKYWIDELYDWVIVKPIVGAGKLANRFIEADALDGGGRGLVWLVGKTSVGLRRVQSGYVRSYALVFLVGAVLILLYYIIRP